MKKHSVLLSVFALAAAFASCQPDMEEEVTLEVTPETVSVGYLRGETVVSITSNSAWHIVTAEDWLSFSVMEGDGNANVVVTVEQNDGDLRSATIIVVGKKIQKQLTLVQQALDATDPKTKILEGVFSVSATKKVNFAKGNLLLDGSFAALQSMPGDLFTWDGVPSLGQFFMLSAEEYEYLVNGREGAANLCGFAQLDGVNGLCIMPDNYTGSSLDPSKGLFLPAAGYAYGENVAGFGEGGSYWSSTSNVGLDFDCLDVYTGNASLNVIRQEVRPAIVAL